MSTHQQEQPAEGPDDPAYTGESEDDEEPGGDGGQVSEVSGMDPAEAGTPIDPSDATAGSPDTGADTGAAGPEAPPPENAEGNEYDKR
jgi:hypothetical protein